MVLTELNIKKFRNYDNLKITCHSGINLIIGDNAQGKTNLLESIYALAFTKSHRTFSDETLVKNGEETFYIKGQLDINNVKTSLEVSFNKDKKQLKVDNDEIKRISDYISSMNVIIFCPDDLELIKGNPINRRRYINIELGQLDKKYLEVLNDYNKLLKMRNEYLKNKAKGISIDENYFNVINEYFIEKAVIIYRMRSKYINKLNNYVSKIYENITNNIDFKIEYISKMSIEENDRDNLKLEIKNKLDASKKQELKFGTTLIGPHRDDVIFSLNDINLKNYGSQGQQRVAVLALKLAEIEIFKSQIGTSPILLMDDVFSELDIDKKNKLLSYIKGDIQTFITTTDLTEIDEYIIKKSKIFKIENGHVINIEEVK